MGFIWDSFILLSGLAFAYWTRNRKLLWANVDTEKESFFAWFACSYTQSSVTVFLSFIHSVITIILHTYPPHQSVHVFITQIGILLVVFCGCEKWPLIYVYFCVSLWACMWPNYLFNIQRINTHKRNKYIHKQSAWVCVCVCTQSVQDSEWVEAANQRQQNKRVLWTN